MGQCCLRNHQNFWLRWGGRHGKKDPGSSNGLSELRVHCLINTLCFLPCVSFGRESRSIFFLLHALTFPLNASFLSWGSSQHCLETEALCILASLVVPPLIVFLYFTSHFQPILWESFLPEASLMTLNPYLNSEKKKLLYYFVCVCMCFAISIFLKVSSFVLMWVHEIQSGRYAHMHTVWRES